MMTKQSKQALLFLIALLGIVALACGGGLPEVSLPEGAAATAEGAAREAATAMARVTIPSGLAATAESAGSALATVASTAGQEGGEILSTVQASDFTVNIDVESGPLRDKIANAQPDANGNLSITITNEDINQAIAAGSQAAPQEMALQNVVAAFTGGNIVLTAAVTQPVQAQLVAAFRPEVVDGRLTFALVSASLGGVPIPSPMIAAVETALNDRLAVALTNLPDNYTLQEVTMGEGTMTLVARPAG